MKIKKKSDLNKKTATPAAKRTKRWILITLLLITIIIMLPFTIILLIGLLPTITLLITDPKNSPKLVTIGCFNMAGVFIYLLHVINHYSMDGAIDIVRDVFNLIIMLGSAGIGLILYCELPNLFIFFSKISAGKRMNVIDKKLADMAEEWGQEVITEQSKNIK
ncbi:MAG: hypothetical protein J6L86_06195 [Alphaproteobacteria bacterium]|nr:hypothetical protein [Alphaproteobacteria bacterium]MBQ8630931.1 hypothetical protein [Alphaproteobacteria bacterium]